MSSFSTPPHRLSAGEVFAELGVDAAGLSSSEVSVRLERYGRNELASTPRPAWWRRLLAQFQDVLILILLAAAAVAFVVSDEVKTPAVVLVVVVVNAVIGFVQENRAERSMEALRSMLVTQARVRRGGRVESVDARELVPGDVVLLEAGDRVPADGRLFLVAGVEAEEAALTGESQPVEKSVEPVADVAAGLGDRRCMVFMNTTVTRGRGEMVVTATGMSSEIGQLAGLLDATERERTPLQRQLDALAHSLAKLAAVIVAAVFVIGLVRGDSVSELLLMAVALAVAAIPEGLPAVTAVTLALGVAHLAKKQAIVKRLASVETLGCTSVICSDKTGTLTLNQMTAVELVVQLRRHRVTGDGYSTVGGIEHLGADQPVALDAALLPLALCNDAVLRVGADGVSQVVGDPTEAALVVLAVKGGLDVDDLRVQHPRLAELPFDSANKFMATVHEVVDTSGVRSVALFAKGAPDVLLGRSSFAIGSNGVRVPVGEASAGLLGENERLASSGLRVIAVGQRLFSVDEWAAVVASDVPVLDLVDGLTLLALVGIVDPPRPEARAAIATAREAGIEVKMITGDHVSTASAIARDLGVAGRAMTGSEIERLSDLELRGVVGGVGVFARVSPEHKLRLVSALQANGNVTAMTGDGVNDAPALKKADIGVAMGQSGTEVTKEAASMVLADDNFSTIVAAVRHGRAIYDNIVKFVRFQLSTTVGFALTFLAAVVFDVASGQPFTAVAVLWVNIIMDGPPAMALGLDAPSADVMRRRPRPPCERILTPSRWSAVLLAAVVMAAGTLAVLAWAPGAELAGSSVASVAGTMAFNTFVLFQFFDLLNVRSDTVSVFSRYTFSNRSLWVALGAVVALQVAVTYVPFMQDVFRTTALSVLEWLVCVAVASSVLWAEELRKLVVRFRAARRVAALPPVASIPYLTEEVSS